jgi:hypothetical protein
MNEEQREGRLKKKSIGVLQKAADMSTRMCQTHHYFNQWHPQQRVAFGVLIAHHPVELQSASV